MNVLVTGASSGIGRAAVEHLLERGHAVWATARRPEAIADLAERGARALALEVTDEDSRVAAVAAVEAEHGQVDALVNNAGYGEYGPVELVPLERVRAQYETNVLAPLRLAQLVLPGMRRAGSGRIVNVSSMGGRIVLPGGGVYHSSKYALEALSDALRVEVAPFGVQVVLVEPGPIRSEFGSTAGSGLDAREPYAEFSRAVGAQLRATYSGPAARPPRVVADAIVRAVEEERPPPRIVVTAAGKALVHLRRLGGTRVWDAVVVRALAPYRGRP